MASSSSTSKTDSGTIPDSPESPQPSTSKEGLPPPRSPSPESSKCAICLGELVNRSISNNCCHYFCFACLVEWSKVKPECPLCKSPFQTIIHNIRSNTDYDEYHVPAPIPLSISLNAAGRVHLAAVGAPILPAHRHRHEIDHGYSISGISIMGHGMARLGLTAGIQLFDWHERLRPRPPTYYGPERSEPNAARTSSSSLPPNPTYVNPFNIPEGEYWGETYNNAFPNPPVQMRGLQLRRRIYDRDLWVNPIATPAVYQQGSATYPSIDYLRAHPHCIPRIVRFIAREMTVLVNLTHSRAEMAMIFDSIMNLMYRYDIRSREFRHRLRTHFGYRTKHFQHELYNFVVSGINSDEWDRSAVYPTRPRTASAVSSARSARSENPPEVIQIDSDSESESRGNPPIPTHIGTTEVIVVDEPIMEGEDTERMERHTTREQREREQTWRHQAAGQRTTSEILDDWRRREISNLASHYYNLPEPPVPTHSETTPCACRHCFVASQSQSQRPRPAHTHYSTPYSEPNSSRRFDDVHDFYDRMMLGLGLRPNATASSTSSNARSTIASTVPLNLSSTSAPAPASATSTWSSRNDTPPPHSFRSGNLRTHVMSRFDAPSHDIDFSRSIHIRDPVDRAVVRMMMEVEGLGATRDSPSPELYSTVVGRPAYVPLPVPAVPHNRGNQNASRPSTSTSRQEASDDDCEFLGIHPIVKPPPLDIITIASSDEDETDPPSPSVSTPAHHSPKLESKVDNEESSSGNGKVKASTSRPPIVVKLSKVVKGKGENTASTKTVSKGTESRRRPIDNNDGPSTSAAMFESLGRVTRSSKRESEINQRAESRNYGEKAEKYPRLEPKLYDDITSDSTPSASDTESTESSEDKRARKKHKKKQHKKKSKKEKKRSTERTSRREQTTKHRKCKSTDNSSRHKNKKPDNMEQQPSTSTSSKSMVVRIPMNLVGKKSQDSDSSTNDDYMDLDLTNLTPPKTPEPRLPSKSKLSSVVGKVLLRDPPYSFFANRPVSSRRWESDDERPGTSRSFMDQQLSVTTIGQPNNSNNNNDASTDSDVSADESRAAVSNLTITTEPSSNLNRGYRGSEYGYSTPYPNLNESSSFNQGLYPSQESPESPILILDEDNRDPAPLISYLISPYRDLDVAQNDPHDWWAMGAEPSASPPDWSSD